MAGPDGWTGWFERHGPALVLFARQWIANPSDAEDVVQEAFLRFWRTKDRAIDPIAYLYACVRNCARERIRCHARRVRREEAVSRRDTGLFAAPVEMDD